MLLLALFAAFATPAPDELGERLASLSAPTARERSEAQAWIGRNARRGDFPRLLETARGGDAEVRGRLARALAAEDRHLTLAVLFAGETDPGLAAIGERVIEDAVLRWSEELSEPALVGPPLQRILERLVKRDAPPPLSLDLTRPLAENLALLRRHGLLPFGLVADPGLLLRPIEPDAVPRVVSGSWADLLRALAREHGMALEGYGLGTLEDPSPVARRWLRLAPLPDHAQHPGAELLTRWCLRAALGASEERRAEGARALAAAGWPAGLAFLEERWTEDGDEAALQGLLEAAAAGRVVPTFARPDQARGLIARADRALARGDAGIPEAEELLHALASVGCLGTRGEDLSQLLFEEWASRSARQRWWRLAVLEKNACRLTRDGDDEARLRALLSDRGAPHELRLQALRAWCRATAGDARPVTLADPRGLVERARSLHQARELLALFERAGLAPVDVASEWVDADDTTLAFGCAWLLVAAPSGSPPPARALDRAARGSSVERLVVLIRDLLDRGLASSVGPAFRRAAQETPGPGLERVAFRLGLLRGPALEAYRDRAGPLEEQPPRLLAAWALWGGEEASQEARDYLVLRFRGALSDPDGLEVHGELVQALQTVVDTLFAGGEDREAERLVARIRRFLDTLAEARLARDLERTGFPAPPGAPPEPLERRARRFDPQALPG